MIVYVGCFYFNELRFVVLVVARCFCLDGLVSVFACWCGCLLFGFGLCFDIASWVFDCICLVYACFLVACCGVCDSVDVGCVLFD